MGNRHDEIRQFVNSKLSTIDAIKDMTFQTVCLFSLLECFAQEHSDYPKGEPGKVFRKFLIDFLDKEDLDILNLVDPISLYYNCDKLESIYSLDNLTPMIYNPIQIQNGCADILQACDNCLDDKCDKKEKHKYLNLLYRCRNKISHEMQTPTTRLEWMQEESHISYHKVSNVWHLSFHNVYLKNIFNKAIKSFINQRDKNSIDPFVNNDKARRKFIAWYY